MAITSFSLTDLFQKAFGYESTAFKPDFQPVIGELAERRKEAGAAGAPYYAKLGKDREYFMPVRIKYPESSNGSAAVPAGESSSKGKVFDLDFPVVSIESRKTIVETALTERRGTVKELINTRDYLITIKGFIISATHDYPEEGVTALRTLYEQNIAFSIECALTDIFLLRPDRSGSDKVVITELKLPVLQGVKHICPYELKLISDEPFNLISVK